MIIYIAMKLTKWAHFKLTVSSLTWSIILANLLTWAAAINGTTLCTLEQTVKSEMTLISRRIWSLKTNHHLNNSTTGRTKKMEEILSIRLATRKALTILHWINTFLEIIWRVRLKSWEQITLLKSPFQLKTNIRNKDSSLPQCVRFKCVLELQPP